MPRFAFALAVPFALVAVAVPADPEAVPAIPKESYRRAADADIAVLQKTLALIAAAPDEIKGRVTTSKGVALVLMRYADALRDDALKSQALKVIQQLDAKDWKAAAEAGKGLTAPKADPAALKEELPKPAHSVVFAPFRSARTGGLDVHQNLMDELRASKDLKQMDVKLVELVGVRSAVVVELGAHLAPIVVDRPVKQGVWDHYINETNRAGREIAIEAAKGEKADRKKLKGLLSRLYARCTSCHPHGRDDD